MKIIEQLHDADKILAADGYKDYSYVRLAISEAINNLTQKENATPVESPEVTTKKTRDMLVDFSVAVRTWHTEWVMYENKELLRKPDTMYDLVTKFMEGRL